MTRKDDIEKAAAIYRNSVYEDPKGKERISMDEDMHFLDYAFWAGAEWADLNPAEKPIEKCNHPKEKLKQRLIGTPVYENQNAWSAGTITCESEYICECGAKVLPKEFEEC